MKAALIGYGYWGRMLERYIVASDAFELKKVYSPELEKTDIYTNDISEVENSDEIEAVFIATPVDTHYDLCKRFLLSGKHVFCEKPATKTLDELTELIALAEEKKRILYIDYLYMNSPSINYIKEHIEEIGKLYRVEGCIEQFGKFYPDDDIYGIIGVHIVSGILYMLGVKNIRDMKFENPLRVGNGNSIQTECSFVADESIKASIQCNLVSNHKIRMIRIFGEKGYFLYDMNGTNSIEKMLYEVDVNEVKQQAGETKSLDEHNSLELVMGSFAHCIESMDAVTNNQVAVLVQNWLEAARRSYR